MNYSMQLTLAEVTSVLISTLFAQRDLTPVNLSGMFSGLSCTYCSMIRC